MNSAQAAEARHPASAPAWRERDSQPGSHAKPLRRGPARARGQQQAADEEEQDERSRGVVGAGVGRRARPGSPRRPPAAAAVGSGVGRRRLAGDPGQPSAGRARPHPWRAGRRGADGVSGHRRARAPGPGRRRAGFVPAAVVEPLPPEHCPLARRACARSSAAGKSGAYCSMSLGTWRCAFLSFLDECLHPSTLPVFWYSLKRSWKSSASAVPGMARTNASVAMEAAKRTCSG